MIPVRLAAARVLLAVEAGTTTLGAEVARMRQDVPERDKGLLVELTSGVFRWRAELDARLAAASQRSVSRIEAPALAVLRLGAYQIGHLDRIPAHAVVHESVETIRALRAGAGAAGFVNAVLRALIRRRHAIHLPRRPGEDGARDAKLAYLSVTLSHPRWLVERWLDRFGFEAAERWCQFDNAAGHVTVRPLDGRPTDVWLEQLSAAGIEAARAPHARDAIRLPPGALGQIPPDLRTGLAVQDEGSQLVAQMVAPGPNERILDACAAPGGKTAIIAAGMMMAGAGGLLVAADLREARVGLLAETLARAHVHVPLLRLDARGPLPFGPVFDAVLLDAPCSGLGTLRRDPDVKWARTAADLPALAEAQLAMLRACAAIVKPGGRLVYATCSSEPEENADVLSTFLSIAPEFAPGAPAATIPADLLTPEGWLVTRPDRDALDAYFAAVLARRRTA